MTIHEMEDEINNADNPRDAHAQLECGLTIAIAVEWDPKHERFHIPGIGRFMAQWAKDDIDMWNHRPVRTPIVAPETGDWKPVSDKQALHIVARQEEIQWHKNRLRTLDRMNGDSGTKVRMVKR